MVEEALKEILEENEKSAKRKEIEKKNPPISNLAPS